MTTAKTDDSFTQPDRQPDETRLPHQEGFQLRVLTYNIHSCVNRLGQVSPDNVLAAIEPLRPDVVALQEVDVGIPRTQYQNQPRLLAERLGMASAFFPTVHHPEGRYGLALLNKFDNFQISNGDLPLYAELICSI